MGYAFAGLAVLLAALIVWRIRQRERAEAESEAPRSMPPHPAMRVHGGDGEPLGSRTMRQIERRMPPAKHGNKQDHRWLNEPGSNAEPDQQEADFARTSVRRSHTGGAQ